MNKFLLFLALLSINIICSKAFAWNFSGHVLVAQIAYDNLNPTTKEQADKLSALIFNQLPDAEQKKLNQHYSNATTFAKVAMLPDVWRKWHLSTILENFHAQTPNNLLPYVNGNTQKWHYTNIAYPKDNHCNLLQEQNVAWAIPKIEKALETTKDENTKAVMMILEEHYIADSYQPLHTITEVNASCQGDEGGNNFCLKTNAKGRCTKNLHALWDSGVGYIHSKINISRSAYRLEQQYPRSQLQAQLQSSDPMSWINASYSFAPFIYGLKENQQPSPAYMREGQAIATKQIVLAGYRLAMTLNSELSSTT